MATGYGTASGVFKGVGGMASMIPVYGQAVGAGLSAVGGILDMVDAQKQKEEAEKIQKAAEKVKKQPLEKEYLQALRGQKMLALSGLPEYDRAKQNIDLGAANALKSIKEASPYGGSVVDAINAVLNKGSQQKADIDVQQAQAKLGLQKDVLNTLYNVGGLQRELTKEQRTRQEALYSQAQDLMAASTANKQIGREKALGAGIQGVGALAQIGREKALGAGIQGVKALGAGIQGVGGLAKLLGNIDMSNYGGVRRGSEITDTADSESGAISMDGTAMSELSASAPQTDNMALSKDELDFIVDGLIKKGSVKDYESGKKYLQELGYKF